MVLRQGEIYNVYISHLSDSPCEFYYQLVNNEETVDELMASISDFYTDKSPPPATLEVGRYCVAKYSGNDAWHRAMIVEMDGEEGGGGENVMVQFVDFGNCEVVSPSQVLGLSPGLGALAKQAVCCSLVDDPNLKLPDESIARYLQIDAELCYRILVTRILESSRYLVELSDFNGADLNESILNVTSESPVPSGDTSSLHLKTLSYPVSSTADVYASFLNSPSSFYCQPLALAADLDAMMEELAGAVSGGGLEGLESVCPGTHCLAQFSDDSEWYRARVQSVSGNGTDIVVHFVDYGNSESTSLSSLLKCPPSLIKVPVQALDCSVFDFSSIAGVEWTGDALEEFRAQLSNEALSLRVSEFESETCLCVCSLSSNGSPMDFSPLFSSLRSPQHFGGDRVDKSPHPPVPGNQDVIEGLSSEPPYASSASSSSLPPAAAVAVTTSDGKTSEHSGGTSDDGRGVSSGRGLLPGRNFGPSAAMSVNISILALKGSSHTSGEDLSDTESSEEVSNQGGGKGEPLIKAPFTLTLSVPEDFEAIVVYVESPSFMFLQRLDCHTELDTLSVEIEQYCASFAEKQHQEIFQEGDFVLAQYSDEVWYRAKVVEAGADASFRVFFIDFGNVAQTVLNYLHDECEQGNVSNYDIPEEPEEEEEDSQNPDQVTPKVYQVPTDQPKPKSVEMKLQQSQSTGSSSSPVLQRSLEIGSEYEVYLLSCESPHSFFVQLASDTEALEEISAALESVYESRDTSELVLPRPPSVGEYVCSHFSEDLKWYRAKVLGFDPTDTAKVELLFIDYGNREMGEVAGLRILSPSPPLHPPLALECFLAGVEPSEGQGSFTGNASELILELAGHGETVCKIEVQFADSAGHYGVNLSGGEGVNVTQSLIDANLASAVQDTPTTAASNSEATPDQLQSGVPPPDQPELPPSAEEPLAVTDKYHNPDPTRPGTMGLI